MFVPHQAARGSRARGRRPARSSRRGRRMALERLEDRTLLAAPVVGMVKDIRPGPFGSEIVDLTAFAGKLYFSASDSSLTGPPTGKGDELWVSDGTEQGTSRITEIRPGGGSRPRHLTAVEGLGPGGTLFFSADDGVHGRELWALDGATGEVRLVKELTPGRDSTDFDQLVAFRDRLIFTISGQDASGSLSSELWTSDGTEDGTHRVSELLPGLTEYWIELETSRDAVFFTGNDGQLGLWRTDGTEVGTFPVRRNWPASAGGGRLLVHQMEDVNGTLYFSSTDPDGYLDSPLNLWKSDGSEAGTVRIKRPGGLIGDLTHVGGVLYFAEGSFLDWLWISNGTPAGTLKLPVNPLPGSIIPEQIREITDVHGVPFYSAMSEIRGASGGFGRELWKGPGSTLVKDIVPGPSGSSPERLTPYDGPDGIILAFTASTDAGRELWLSDGDELHPQGTFLARDINPGPFGSQPFNMTVVGDILFFTAHDGIGPDEHGEELWAVNAPDPTKGRIAGVKFHDLNGDRDRDVGEPGLNGWTIQLQRPDGSVVATTTTATDASGVKGAYRFTNIDPGTYLVREVETDHAGWVRNTDNPGAVTVTPGSVAPNVDFGNFRMTSISGVLFQDFTGNGQVDGAAGNPEDPADTGLGGWTVFVDDNDNGKCDGDEVRDETDPNTGAYALQGLKPGLHRVRATPPAGQETLWMQTTGLIDIPGRNNRPASPDDYEQISGQNIGEFRFIAIGGRKYEDSDGNGQRDPGEGVPAGPDNQWMIVLTLDSDNDGQFDDGTWTRLTDAADGSYSFPGLGPGRYRVREVADKPDWVGTSADPNDLRALSGQDRPDPAAGRPGVDFGNFHLITIQGVKFHDLNGNGTRDDGEGPLEGREIYLEGEDADHPHVITGADGVFTFTRVGPGVHHVREAPPSDEWASFQPPDLLARSGQDIGSPAADLGNFRRIKVSGVKFHDRNGDGFRDEDEEGLAGWRIFLDRNGDDIPNNGEREDFTDENGEFVITGVGPGLQFPREVAQPTDWIRTSDLPDPLLPRSGEDESDIEFGNFSAVIRGHVWDDVNLNGIDDGEPDLGNWKVFLDDGGSEKVAMTDGQGDYRFVVGPGTYLVTTESPCGQTTGDPEPIEIEVSPTVVSGMDFGVNIGRATYSGRVFNDLDQDEEYNPDIEPALAGFTIYLDRNGNETREPDEPFDVSGDDGSYSISIVGAGPLVVRQQERDGWERSSGDSDEFDPCDSGDVVTDFGNHREEVFPDVVLDDVSHRGDPLYFEAEFGNKPWRSSQYDPRGYEEDYRYHDADFRHRESRAVWKFGRTDSDLDAGLYQVYATWPSAPSHATNARYRFLRGDNFVPNSDTFVNQQLPPDGALYDGRAWQPIGPVIALRENQILTVRLLVNASARVVADGMMVVFIDDLPSSDRFRSAVATTSAGPASSPGASPVIVPIGPELYAGRFASAPDLFQPAARRRSAFSHLKARFPLTR